VTRDSRFPLVCHRFLFTLAISELAHFTVTRLTERLLDASNLREAAKPEADAAHGVEHTVTHHSSRSTTQVATRVSWGEEEEEGGGSSMTCPLHRLLPRPKAHLESPNFPTKVLFFSSQDEVSTGHATQQ
jgi:hypothetical protein